MYLAIDEDCDQYTGCLGGKSVSDSSRKSERVIVKLLRQ